VLRSLVVNADDLGLTVGVNNGIFDAHDRGIVTSASLMANALAAANAIGRLRSRPALGIGVHLTLVDGKPMLPPGRIPSLVQDDGQFRASWKPFIVACLMGRVALDDVERELTAQIDRVVSEGIRPTHLDTHKHVHVYPPVFAIVARLAARTRIPVIRVPYERSIGDLLLAPWTKRDYCIASSHGIRTPQFVGRATTGVMHADSLSATLRGLRPGHTELMVHPGHVDEMLRRMPTRLLASRAQEVELLCSPDTADVVVNEDIQLVRHDLTPVGLAPTRSFRDAS
jgi:predicted glycoside hydrolase/deacetylase ChbG (UPF0249 family)